MPETDPVSRQILHEEFTGSTFAQSTVSLAASSQDGKSVSPISIAEIAALVSLVSLSDMTLYRSEGFLGPGVLFLVAPWLLAIGKSRVKWDRGFWPIALMLSLIALRLSWCGSFLAIAVGFVVLCCAAMTLSGLRPYLSQAFQFALTLIARGFRGLHDYVRIVSGFSPAIVRTYWFAVVLPAMTLLTFGAIFVLANPDLVKSFGEHLTWFVERLGQWLSHFQIFEIVFCLGIGWISIGYLRPSGQLFKRGDSSARIVSETAASPYYDAYRNTLVVVIGLFAVYLVFEFQTLWFRTFPPGFHYSGYAHEGAAWLTVALGLATLLLSLIFRGTILSDPRLAQLKTLSWIWSLENLLLAVAVFNRLFIYIGFNGMTRMRVVGMLGVASVIGGFILVLRKIAGNREFTWLIRRQLWTVAMAIYFYAVLPVDGFVNRFNVNRILAGDPRPSVQISVHRTSDEGWLCLSPLIDCTDPLIRDGIRGMLDEKLDELERNNKKSHDRHWTVQQIATDRLFVRLRSTKSRWASDSWWNASDESGRRRVIEEFRDYAYRWY